MSMPGLSTLRPSTRGGYVLESNAVQLIIRQQPECALLTQENKEKGRKPIDPPPIVQMLVDRSCDPQEQWIVSPYLFMIAVIVEGEEGDTLLPSKYLVGQTSSSLHRLKDIDNKDGGFFVFGDISVRKAGKHRLRFNLFDTDKETGDVMLLKTIESDVFEVVSNKEFRGLTESTHLSRTFSDQGVRLRLRKEPRTIQGGVKRSYGTSEQGSPGVRTASAGYGGPVHDSSYGGYPSAKRQRADPDYASTSTSSYYSDPTNPFYGTNTLSSNAPSASGRWGEQVTKGSTSLGYSLSGRPHSSYSIGSSSGHLGRVYPHISQSASQLGGVSYGNKANYFDDGYSQQSSQYFSQSQTDPYALSGMHASSSMADSSSLASSSRPGTQGYMTAGGDYGVHSGSVTTPQSASHSTPYATDISGSAYTTVRPGSSSLEASQAYASSSTAAGLPFDQSSQAGLGSSLYSQSGPPSVQNPYATGMSRMQYPVQPSGVSHTGVPEELFNSTLNSTWAGAYGDQDSTPVGGSGIGTQSLTAVQASRYPVSSTKQQWS